VTGSPDFEEATPTRPYLTVVAPAVTELLRVEQVESNFPVQQFSVQVTSEDADELLEATLLIDYGDGRDVGAAVQQPYQEDWSTQTIPAGTLTDGPRLVTLTWLPTLKVAGAPECHSVTMMVVRRPYGSSPYAWCPTDDHFATVTWFAALCPEPGSCSFQSCPTKGQDSYQYCPNPSELGQAEAAP
jgi:hypothetical protein